MKRVLAILGDYYHEEVSRVEALNAVVKRGIEEGNPVEVEYITYEELMVKLKDRPDAVILSKANQLNPVESPTSYWMDLKIEKEVCEYVNNGGGWFVWHSGLSSYEMVGNYYSMVRGKFDYHPSEQQVVSYFPVENTNTITDIQPFEMKDEHYFVTCDEQHTNVFLRAISQDGSSIAGWSHEYGKGRVICITPGHSKVAMMDEAVTELLYNSLKWSCRM
ncbi:ThuA domain-containing protein [Bacillus sp. PS06]|uniref:ThuA domain-containing protein n=1 Tax=Bacillus sp. PS06 TaxID=2764176 RepID=UPI00177C042E|nr:ThuA domain-containing protein [Bacillus sp. PS06]MBD8068647.1 ThuA domain-containing protein [Bacillus sp. PS06]